MENDKGYPCGCFFTQGHLCQEAKVLWDQVQEAYEKANRLQGTWEEYARAHNDYMAHFQTQDQEA